jgi:hypothetical protein
MVGRILMWHHMHDKRVWYCILSKIQPLHAVIYKSNFFTMHE